MAMGRPKAELVLSEAEHAQLSSMARSRSIPAALALRARIVLAAAEGTPNSAIAERLQTNGKTAGKWRTRFIERRINGLYDELRPGKPRMIDDERVAELINKTLHTKPADGATHWSVRAVAAETAMSHASVHRYFKLFGLQPHRSESFRLSTDPFFIDKLRDVVGLYLSPQRTPWCCALTRRASARRWSARSRARRAPVCSSSKFNASADNRLVQCPLSAEADLEAANPSDCSQSEDDLEGKRCRRSVAFGRLLESHLSLHAGCRTLRRRSGWPS